MKSLEHMLKQSKNSSRNFISYLPTESSGFLYQVQIKSNIRLI